MIRLILFIVLGMFWVLADLFIPFVKAHQLPFCFIYYFYIYELGNIFCKKNYKNINGKYSIGLYLISIILSVFVRSSALNIILTETIITPLAVIAFYYMSLKIKENAFFSFLGKYSFYIFLLHEPIIERKLSYFLFAKLDLNHFYPSILPVSFLTIFFTIGVYKLLGKFHINKLIF
jgi:peptidoglycan/LPS O-acetylase OafA/YrhL